MVISGDNLTMVIIVTIYLQKNNRRGIRKFLKLVNHHHHHHNYDHHCKLINENEENQCFGSRELQKKTDPILSDFNDVCYVRSSCQVDFEANVKETRIVERAQVKDRNEESD